MGHSPRLWNAASAGWAAMKVPDAIPKGGSYLLVIRLARPALIRVGAKGTFEFPAGWYLYAGSAKRGLHARIERHLRRKKRMRWHIDYLLRRAVVRGVLAIGDRRECDLARALLDRGGRVIVSRFGSSDCRCPSHLLRFPRRPSRLL